MSEICQDRLPIIPWMDPILRRLPGIQPLGDAPWLWRDEAFAAQMTYRDRLLAKRRDAVFACEDRAVEACGELLATVIAALAGDDGYKVSGNSILRPDGMEVATNSDHPLTTAARLVQQDLIIMQKRGDEYELTAGVLCFPASWTLSEKLGRGLGAIHGPVDEYDAKVEARVARLFTGIRVGAPLWRANFFLYEEAELHQPRREAQGRASGHGRGRWVRVERQTLLRLPVTGAVIFGIHTFVVPIERLSPRERVGLLAAVKPDEAQETEDTGSQAQ